MLVVASLAVAAGWLLPYSIWFFLPFLYLNTHVHELSHALAALVTGGQVGRILVFANGSGIAEIAGGSLPLIASAGYIGSAALGGLLVAHAKTERGARRALGILAAILGASLLIWVRGDWVGWTSGLVWVLVLGSAARLARGAWAIFGAQFIGLQQCWASIESLFVLLRISAGKEAISDAEIMARATGIPSLFWAVLWFAISLVILSAALRESWSGSGAGRRS